MTIAWILAAAMVAQVEITAPSTMPPLRPTPTIAWTARDVADAAAMRQAYIQNPIGRALESYRARFFWREPGSTGGFHALWLPFHEGQLGDLLVEASKRPIDFDGGCWVVEGEIDAAGRIRFACHPSA